MRLPQAASPPIGPKKNPLLRASSFSVLRATTPYHAQQSSTGKRSKGGEGASAHQRQQGPSLCVAFIHRSHGSMRILLHCSCISHAFRVGNGLIVTLPLRNSRNAHFQLIITARSYFIMSSSTKGFPLPPSRWSALSSTAHSAVNPSFRSGEDFPSSPDPLFSGRFFVRCHSEVRRYLQAPP